MKPGETVIYTYAKHKEDLHDIEAVLLNQNDVYANIHGTENYLVNANLVDVTCEGNEAN